MMIELIYKGVKKMDVLGKLNIDEIEKRAFVNGEYIDAISGAVISKTLSFDGRKFEGIAACGKADVDIAVAAAQKAYSSGGWSRKTPSERKEILLKLADLMEEHIEELALLDTFETGRAYINYLRDSLPKAIEAVRYFAEAVDKLYDESIPIRGSDTAVIKKVSLGVVGLITPWNDPMVVTAWKFAPALLMGNTVVLKPAEQSSLSAIYLGKLTKEAGIPDGVFNVVPGYGEEAGKALALHKDVRGIFFTGSAEVGKKIMEYAGQSNMKRVALECGGKGPYIVSNKCNRMSEAAEVLAKNMFYNQGQICSAPSRAVVHKSVYDEFIAVLKAESEKYVPGYSFDDANEVGCVVSKEQYDKVNGYIDLAAKEGAKIYRPSLVKEKPKGAICITPAILENVNNNMRIAREEIFGPVLAVIKVDSMEEAVDIANDSEFGLAGAVWTDDVNEAFKLTDRMEVGLVHLNSYGNDDNSSPFGGVKQSGIGKDKSIHAFDKYCDSKTIWMHF